MTDYPTCPQCGAQSADDHVVGCELAPKDVTCLRCQALTRALDGLLQHLSEHPSNWPHGDYHSLMNAAEEAIGRDDD